MKRADSIRFIEMTPIELSDNLRAEDVLLTELQVLLSIVKNRMEDLSDETLNAEVVENYDAAREHLRKAINRLDAIEGMLT